MTQRRGIRIPLSEAAWQHILEALNENASVGCKECERIASYISKELGLESRLKHSDRPPEGWWRWNIKDPVGYARSLRVQVVEWEGYEELTVERLQMAIEEDSGEPIGVEECADILKRLVRE